MVELEGWAGSRLAVAAPVRTRALAAKAASSHWPSEEERRWWPHPLVTVPLATTEPMASMVSTAAAAAAVVERALRRQLASPGRAEPEGTAGSLAVVAVVAGTLAPAVGLVPKQAEPAESVETPAVASRPFTEIRERAPRLVHPVVSRLSNPDTELLIE